MTKWLSTVLPSQSNEAPTLAIVDQIYSYCESGTYTKVTAEHPSFESFCKSYGSLRRELGEKNRERFWADLLRPVKRFVEYHLSAPIPFSHSSSITQLNAFHEANRLSAKITGTEYSRRLISLEESLASLASTTDNPLSEKFIELLEDSPVSGPTGIVVCRDEFKPLMYEVLKQSKVLIGQGLGNFVALNPSELRNLSCYERLFVFGNQRLFTDSEHVFTTPRAKEQYVITFSWIKESPLPLSHFENSLNSSKVFPSYIGSDSADPHTQDTVTQKPIARDPIDLDEILPSTDLEAIFAQLITDRDEQDHFEEEDNPVEAHIVKLDNGEGIFLLADGKYDILDVETSLTVAHIRGGLERLEPGDFLVLRTAGGGVDYIRSVADRMMGDEAAKYREIQQRWKTLLKQTVSNEGLEETVRKLRRRECKIANSANIRSWMSRWSIGLQSEKNFNVLLSFLGLGDKCDEVLRATELIRHFHRVAGHRIAKVLKAQLSSVTTTELSSAATKDFELSEEDGGTLTAFRVRKVDPVIRIIPESQIENRFPLD